MTKLKDVLLADGRIPSMSVARRLVLQGMVTVCGNCATLSQLDEEVDNVQIWERVRRSKMHETITDKLIIRFSADVDEISIEDYDLVVKTVDGYVAVKVREDEEEPTTRVQPE